MGWLDELKREKEERERRRRAWIEARKHVLDRVRTRELLEEMNRELLDDRGSVSEGMFGRRARFGNEVYGYSLTWSNYQIRVVADVDTRGNPYLVAVGAMGSQIETAEEALKQALVLAFRRPEIQKGTAITEGAMPAPGGAPPAGSA